MTLIEGNNPIEESIKRYWSNYALPLESSILVALSGGPDSTALLYSLHKFSLGQDLKIGAVYVDHGIRPREELDNDRLYIRRAAESLNVPLFLCSVPKGRMECLIHEMNKSPEEAARILRYNELKQIRKREGYDYIALGHTRDDNLETLIMRFLLGSGPGGMRGIPPKRDYFIRPLLNVSKEEILNYLSENKLKYVTDSTNREENYFRNRVRRRLIPVIKEIFPSFVSTLPSASEQMREIYEMLQQAASELPWEPVEKGFRISYKEFMKKPLQVRIESLYSLYNTQNTALNRAETVKSRLPYRFLKSGLKKLDNSGNGTILRGYGFKLRRSRDYIFWESDVVLKEKKRYLIEIELNKNCYFGYKNYRIDVSEQAADKENEVWMPLESVKFPLIARSKRDGDCINLGLGRKKLKKLYSEWGVPMELRHVIPVLEDQEGIAAVIGRPYGFKNRIAERYKIIKREPLRLVVISVADNGDDN